MENVRKLLGNKGLMANFLVAVLTGINALADGPNPVATTNAQAPQGNWMGMIMPLAMTFVVLYFFMIRPQQKKQKEREKKLAELKPGEEVLTNSGIFGKIHRISDRDIVLEIAPNVRIKILKSSIVSKMNTETTPVAAVVNNN